MKIGIMTDTHLGLVQYGLKEREQDFYDQYQKAIDTFIQSDVDIVVFAGDIFDKPRPSPKALEIFTNGLKDLERKGIDVLNVIGNHGMVQSPGFVTADEFIRSVSSNYYLIDNHDYIEKDGVLFMGLPYHSMTLYDELKDSIFDMNQYAGRSKAKTKILILHQAFSEYCGFDGEDLSFNDIDVSNFDLVICGHIHERKLIETDQCVYLQPGSLERSSIAEARDEEINGKGVYIIDTDFMDIQSIANGFVRLKSLRKFMIADMLMNDDSEVVDVKSKLMNNIIMLDEPPVLFLTVHDTSNSFKELIEVTKQIKNECLTVNFKYFDESGISQDQSFFSTAGGEIPTPRQALKISLNPLDKDEVLLGLELYDMLVAGEDPQYILDNYLLKKSRDDEREEMRPYNTKELDEIKSYFESI